MEIIEYIEEQVKSIKTNNHIRFELGAPFESGSEARLNQVNHRVKTLFESLIEKSDEIILYIFDYETEIDPMFGNTTPDYVYKLLSNQQFDESVYVRYDEDENEDGVTINIEHNIRVYTYRSICSKIPYDKIMEGIANYEQGREPSIGQSLFFICPIKGIIFNMYDDRGCIIYGQDYDTLKKLYHEYNAWIVDYWKSYFDEIYNMS